MNDDNAAHTNLMHCKTTSQSRKVRSTLEKCSAWELG
jgi:hypothetical protein